MITEIIGNLLIPILIVVAALTLVLTLKFIANRYKKVAPNRAGIFYGRKGFKVVTGGGKVQVPFFENYTEMSTAAFQVSVDEDNIPNKDNVKLRVKGVATVKISSKKEELDKAVANLLGKSEQEIKDIVQGIMKGHLRSIIGTLNIDELLRQRDEFNKKVLKESGTELTQIGVEVINLVIQDINDTEGYIDALGKRAVAEAKAEAEIKVAEAKRLQEVAVSNAEKEASLVKAGNEAEIAAAQKERDLKVAGFKKETEQAQAVANMAGEIARAAQEKTLRVAEADRDAARAEAQIKVQEKETLRKKSELEATMIAVAEAERQAAVIKAEAAKKKSIIDAEAEAEVLRTTAEAKKNATVLEGQGQAEARRAVLVAEAEGTAASKRAALMAEAEGTKALNAALAEMSESARFILIMDRLPKLIEQGGEALSSVAREVFAGMAAPLGQIDSIHLVEFGGNGNGHMGGIGKIAGISPMMLTQFLAMLTASGIDVTGLMKKFGIDASGFQSLLGGLSPEGHSAGGKDLVAS